MAKQLLVSSERGGVSYSLASDVVSSKRGVIDYFSAELHAQRVVFLWLIE
jgi:hypothetical protein